MEKQKELLSHHEDQKCIVTGVSKVYPLTSLKKGKERQEKPPTESGYLD